MPWEFPGTVYNCMTYVPLISVVFSLSEIRPRSAHSPSSPPSSLDEQPT